MVKNRENILQLFDSYDAGFFAWKIFQRGKTESGNAYAQMREGVETKTEAREGLETALRLISQGQFTLIVGNPEKGGQSKGKLRADFEITSDSAFTPAPVPIVSGITADDVKRQVEEGINRYKQEQEYERLKTELAEKTRQVREYEQEKTGFFARIMAAVDPYMDKIVPGIAGVFGWQPAAAVGYIPPGDSHVIPNTKTTQEMPNQNEELMKHLQRLVDAVQNSGEQNPVGFFQKLANYIEKNPGKLPFIKTFID